MANNTSLSIEIFGPNLEPIDLLERVTGLRWTERFTSYGDFELWAPITEKNAELLKEENYVWINESDTAGIIEYVEKSRNDKGEKEFHVKGRHLVALLRGRVVYPTFKASGQISSVMKKQIEQYAISPQNENNKIEQLYVYNDADFGDNVSYQQTGSDLMEEQLYLCEANNVGIRIDLDYNNKKMLYKVLRPTDRSWSQSDVDPVMFDSSSDEILSSNYTANKSEVCNVAIVAGEGEGSERKVIEVQEGFYPITNLITNGSFENGMADWAGSMSEADFSIVSDSYHGGKAAKMSFSGRTTGAYISLGRDNIYTVVGHKYYARCMCKVTEISGLSSVDVYGHAEVGLYGSNFTTTWPSDDDFGWLCSKKLDSSHLNEWIRYSIIFNIPSGVDYLQFRPIEARNGCASFTGQTDSVILIDLTETFGAGNEPSKEWCDTHLSYFDGTIYISKDGYVANNMVRNGGMEQNEDVWGFGNITDGNAVYRQDAYVKSGKRSMNLNATSRPNESGASQLLQIVAQPIAGHKYYGRVWYFPYDFRSNWNEINAGHTEFDLIGGSVEKDFGAISGDALKAQDYTWNMFSNIITAESTTGPQLRVFTFAKIQLILDDWILVDLTETFGAGNEPTKEWCDENISFFEGTKVLSPSITKDLKRKELWVDARDLQSTDENDMQLSDAEYNKLLWQRGLQKLSDYKVVENFSSVIKTFGFQQYEYNKDYFLGDTVTVADREIDITMDTQITEVERVWDENGYSFSLTFGKTQPTILDVAKRK